jgi:hypothetical protein
MAGTRARVTQRFGVMAATALLVGGACTGLAFADSNTGGDSGTQSSSSNSSSSSSSSSSSDNSVVKTLDSVVPGGSNTVNAATGAGDGTVAADDTSASAAATTTCNGLDLTPFGGPCIPLTIPSLPTGSSSATTTSSGSGIETVYAPPQYYGGYSHGSYGHRYYGQYHDSGCGCDRYASPNYVPQTVVATQVASVPKGGVNTGDGSFQ